MSSQTGPYRSGKTRFEIFIFRNTYAKYGEYVEYAEYVIPVDNLGGGGMRFAAAWQ